MSRSILRLTGRANPKVLIGPRLGNDTSIVSVNGLVLISSTDPVSYIPQIGVRKSGMLSIHGVASDVAASGIAPRYAMFNLSLPLSFNDRKLKEYWRSIHETCDHLGISIVGGHTGRFPGLDSTVIGGAMMWSFARRSGYVTPAMARPKDDIIITKSAAIEAAAVLASSYPVTVRKYLGSEVLNRAMALLDKTSTVSDALTASSVGIRDNGVTAMHDATEGGVLSAILDLANASGVKATVEEERIPILDETRDICRLFKINPMISLGQGALIIASRPSRTEIIIKALHRQDIPATIVGRLEQRNGLSTLHRGNKSVPLKYPRLDPYWTAYWKGVHAGLQ